MRKRDCIDTVNSTISVNSLMNCGTSNLRIIANINPTSGGLAGYFLRIKNPDGSFAENPEFDGNTSNEWNWAVPGCAGDECQNGNYLISVHPPSGTTNCAVWEAAATFTLAGCN